MPDKFVHLQLHTAVGDFFLQQPFDDFGGFDLAENGAEKQWYTQRIQPPALDPAVCVFQILHAAGNELEFIALAEKTVVDNVVGLFKIYI